MQYFKIVKIIYGLEIINNMIKPKLYILIGISASGKSTIAKQMQLNILSQNMNCVIVSSDDIRQEICEGGVSDQSKNEEVFKIFHRRIRENLLKGNNVIADATNITMRSRRAIFNAIRGIDCRKIGYIIVKRIEDCIKDNKNDDRVAVPDEVIYKQIKKFQICFYNEGFDDIIIEDLIDYSLSDQPYVAKDMNRYRQMLKFDQKTPYHNQTLGEHCNFVNVEFNKYHYPEYYEFAARQHDIGKLYTQTFDENGIAHYLGHENYGAYLLLTDYIDLLYEEKYTTDEILDILFLVNYHMLPMNWNTDKAREKWRNIFGDYRYQLLVDFNKCDKMRPDDKNKLSEL